MKSTRPFIMIVENLLHPLSNDINNGLDNFHFDDDLLTKYDDSSADFSTRRWWHRPRNTSSYLHWMVNLIDCIFHYYLPSFQKASRPTVESSHYDTVVTEQLIRRYNTSASFQSALRLPFRLGLA
ncbi:CBM_HP2_G0032340.mRNA.1.CDS.1 [Saccharomyces cerevisiae]|nr:CBM_HP2_G0032340.mRNA.1.CDS.1 [Saccharomyces cerevisiae]CAI6586807.1 CBM_HP2_G0032340.mRNA.1.CDS.1 [Saccharomyces cerevisiae]